ncbi:MAG: formate dehydrogenase accessory sulfurtransferase FdhD [Desulfobacteraceae bacterium]|nr:formate dehydrogenase accessory sulfurtransferase FdhD [Desulfobacteraceae bacterium]
MIETVSTDHIEYYKGERNRRTRDLIIEEPLSIRVAGSPYSVVMRTPGDEIAHAAGFCLAEGLVDEPGEISAIGFCKEDEINVVTVTLAEQRRLLVSELLERKGFVGQTSCGICGKEVIADINQILAPVPNNALFDVNRVLACIRTLPWRQPLYKKTRGAHAAAIFNKNMEEMASAEDVGRHNALDKAIGKIFLEGKIKEACFAVMSSRLSYELVQKAGRAGIEMMVGISRPTTLAVDLGYSVNMTLACAKGSRFMVFCGDERILSAQSHG